MTTKIDPSRIRSIREVTDAKGEHYYIIGVTVDQKKKNPISLKQTKSRIRGGVQRTWRNRVVKTILIAAAAAVIYEIAGNLAGM